MNEDRPVPSTVHSLLPARAARAAAATLALLVCSVAPSPISSPTSARGPISIDLNGNGVRDFEDFLLFAQAYGSASSNCDYNGSGSVDFTDFLVFALEYSKAVPEREITITLRGGATMKMVWIEPGQFLMGSPQEEIDSLTAGATQLRKDIHEAEGPQHLVTITRGFYIGKYEVTQEQWASVVTSRPWNAYPYPVLGMYGKHPTGPRLPAYSVQWDDIEHFLLVQNLSESGFQLRLPTEAEWEYACRAGTASRWSCGDDESKLTDHARFSANSRSVTAYENIGPVYGAPVPQDVGVAFPNRWGLHDMHGNVAERVQDYLAPYGPDPQTDPRQIHERDGDLNRRILRGGDFISAPRDTRSAARMGGTVSGVRLVMDAR